MIDVMNVPIGPLLGTHRCIHAAECLLSRWLGVVVAVAADVEPEVAGKREQAPHDRPV
jgi:hypothetical protein